MAKSSTIMGQRREFSAQAPAIRSGSQIPSIQFSTGNARALQNFSRTLFGLSSQFEDQLDQQAEAEASKEGAIAGLAGNVEEQSYQTIRGRAYNRAMLETFVTTMDTRAMVNLERLKQQYYNDPVGLEKAANELFGGMSAELEKVAPGAGAAFAGRQTARLLPSVEQARDTRFQLTRQEADANLILHEAAVMGQIKQTAVDLLSDNPARSAAAAAVVAESVGEYMRTFDAVDPITGRPIYSPAEKAQAEVYIREKVATDAALGWFDAQEDKTEAYLRLSDPEFKFTLNMHGEKPANVVSELKGKTRSLPVKKDVEQKLALAGGALGNGVTVHITSGGQVSRAEARQGLGRRTGSDRHDHGNAADVVLSVNGRKVTPRENPQLYQQFLENAAAAGFTGLGHYDWGVHVGGGSEAAWGPDTSRRTLDPAFAAAIDRGRVRAKQGGIKLADTQTIDRPLTEILSETAMNNLDAEMWRRISRANSQADRAARQEKERLETEQATTAVDVAARIFAAGKPDPQTGEPIPAITETDILALSDMGSLSPEKAQSFIKAIATEKPERSDTGVKADLQARIWAGEDVEDEIIRHMGAGRLTDSDARTLHNQNEDRNVNLTTEERLYYQRLNDLIAPTGIIGDFDEARQQRAFAAQEEFLREAKRRGETGKTLEQITNDIARRAVLDDGLDIGTRLDGMLLPRGAVLGDKPEDARSLSRWVDPQASAQRLVADRDAGRITPAEFEERSAELAEWLTYQNQYLEQRRKAAGLSGAN